MPLEFRCADAGAVCNRRFVADTQDELLAQVAAHLQEEHNVQKISQTLANFAVEIVRTT
jgi:predicted small metal-binding protein